MLYACLLARSQISLQSFLIFPRNMQIGVGPFPDWCYRFCRSYSLSLTHADQHYLCCHSSAKQIKGQINPTACEINVSLHM